MKIEKVELEFIRDDNGGRWLFGAQERYESFLLHETQVRAAKWLCDNGYIKSRPLEEAFEAIDAATENWRSGRHWLDDVHFLIRDAKQIMRKLHADLTEGERK